MKSKIGLSAVLVLISVAAYASGAPWYKWQNTLDKTVMCTQLSPGESWQIVQGPFMESNCRKPGFPQ